MIGLGEVVALAYRRGAEDKPVILSMGSYSDVRERGEHKVRASCSFCADFVEKNPEFKDLLAD